jgi:hypothetical protein
VPSRRLSSHRGVESWPAPSQPPRRAFSFASFRRSTRCGVIRAPTRAGIWSPASRWPRSRCRRRWRTRSWLACRWSTGSTPRS